MPLPDINFCLKDCRCGGKNDSVFFISCLILGVCFLECNHNFINVFGIYYVENTLTSYNCNYTMV